jgi:hypothetical protein
MSTPRASGVREIIEPVDPRERFARPASPQEEQGGSGSASSLSPLADYGEKSYQGNGRLTGRIALLTGADRGIGRAVALCFAKEGADVLFAYLEADADEQLDAEETVRLVEAIGRKAVAIAGDVRKKAFCQDLVQRTIEVYGRIDIVVNDAAFQGTYVKLTDITEEEFEPNLSDQMSTERFSLCRQRCLR